MAFGEVSKSMFLSDFGPQNRDIALQFQPTVQRGPQGETRDILCLRLSQTEGELMMVG